MTSITPKHAFKSYKTQRGLQWDGSSLTISGLARIVVGLARDKLALQHLEVGVNHLGLCAGSGTFYKKQFCSHHHLPTSGRRFLTTLDRRSPPASQDESKYPKDNEFYEFY